MIVEIQEETVIYFIAWILQTALLSAIWRRARSVLARMHGRNRIAWREDCGGWRIGSMGAAVSLKRFSDSSGRSHSDLTGRAARWGPLHHG